MQEHELSLLGLKRRIIEKLVRAGFATVEDLLYHSSREIMDRTGLPKKVVDDILSRAAVIADSGFKSAYEMLITERIKITTGCKNLDKLLRGGIEVGNITEVFGEHGSGKSQFAMQLAVMVQLPPKDGGLGKKAIYIDTEGSFSPSRIGAIAKFRGLDPNIVLSRIIYKRVAGVFELLYSIRKAAKLVRDHDAGILIVDSLTAPFRLEYQGLAALAERQQKIEGALMKLARIASYEEIAVLITNQVVESPGTKKTNIGSVGGHVIAHVSNLRILFRKGVGNKRIAMIEDSSFIPVGETIFVIKDRGITDP